MKRITAYQPLPIAFEQGDGVWLWDTANNRYLDMTSGIAVCSLGHAHPRITEVIAIQAEKLLHTSNAYQIEWQQILAQELAKITGMKQCFFTNSGAESNETAIKIARLYGRTRHLDNPQIIVTYGAFHGRTMATLSASGSQRVQKGFEPLVPGFLHVPYDDLSAIEQLAKQRQDIVAVMVEPIQGENGIIIPQTGYLEKLQTICHQQQWLFILDEVQTGVGRTGQWYAYQHEYCKPDVLTTAKALGNGIPIGACLMDGAAQDLLQPGYHGSTFGGNPLACRVAHQVLQVIKQEGYLEQAEHIGQYLLERLQQTLSSPLIVDIRGKGLMVGIELTQPCRPLMAIAAQYGILINITAERVIRLTPPLLLTKQEIDWFIPRLQKSLEQYQD